MRKDSLKAVYARNRRLIRGCWLAGCISMMLLAIGTVFARYPEMFGPVEKMILSLAISLSVAILFGLWTTRSTPIYAQTPLEYGQERVERAIIEEWGESISWLRGTIAAAEECSVDVTKLHRSYLKEGTEPTLRQTALLLMHNRLCDLSRAVADLC